MIEYKFRAWDTITNRMHNTIEELCFENGILIEVIFKKSWDGIGSCADEIVEWQNADQTILMQYTGLKDKNGVEIYDGDTIKCTDGADEIDMLDSNTGIGCVEWNDIYGFWSISKIENGLGDILQCGYVEVIGNVHEQESHT